MSKVASEPYLHSSKDNFVLPGILFGLALIVFSSPFVQLQARLFLGLTLTKVLIPFIILYILSIRGTSIKLHPHSGYFFFFICFTLPSLFLGTDEYIFILTSLVGYILLFQVLYNSIETVGALRKLFSAYVFGLFFISSFTILSFVTGVDMSSFVGKPLIEYWYGLPVFVGSNENLMASQLYLLPAFL